MTLLLAFKIALVCLLVIIIINLGRAMFLMVRQPHAEQPRSMSHYLGRRVILSVLVVVLLLVAMGLGWITPNPRPY
ncbi:DUF2909 domain-containing protein [Shewanella sp. NIFS-20-20]|uniref:DUF2909 domain-containing protein n=1 Tax=Shewanella sp. NIFS-20-20 TaxID=2853806 RepID=UPI001C45919C|nr:DUF2909 domain-containing protein [Shewanella sp. NIFS-20-20]MBV7316933.1 DUF2909 domain-containing protein [Shewanella sp. NIFS-20-20]